ncbi:polyprenyl synthetase [Streptomyces sp. NPDC059477]|uniref:polyprenyl synthetase n=1 Tax=Streptomyces sp. NPDC059477 TaxID=3346847 RepID=UPI003689F915
MTDRMTDGTADGTERNAGQRRAGLDEQALLLAAGLADLAVSTVGTALGTVRGLLRRSDGAELAEQAEQDLMARGRLALDRYTAVPPAHLEILARNARSTRNATTHHPVRDV